MFLMGTNKPERFTRAEGVTDDSDTILAGGGADFIEGLGGNDHILGGEGGDYINGGDGFDTSYYYDSEEGVFISLGMHVARGGTAQDDVLESIEGLVGSRFDDQLHGNERDNLLRGDGGNDQLYGLAGNDLLQGGSGADILDGGIDFDTADYGASDAAVLVDLLLYIAAGGFAQGDSLHGIEALIGSAYNDLLLGNNEANELRGGGLDDTLAGRGGADRLYGEDGSDTLEGGAGGDFLDGGAGINTASYASASTGLSALLAASWANSGDAAGDTYTLIQNLRGSNFNDALVGDDNDNTLEGLFGIDWLDGGSGRDHLIGGNQDDWLFGGDGGDLLEGGEGNDTLYGGVGDWYVGVLGVYANADMLDGGAGADRFVWNSLDETGFIAYDTIRNFNAAEGDRIDVSAIDADATVSGRQHFTFVNSATPGRGQIGYDPGMNAIVFNNDGDAAIEGFINLTTPVGTPNAGWFMF